MPDPLRAIVTYWQAVRQDRFAPTWADFHLDELDPQLVPWCSVVDVVDGGSDFTYRFWGTARGALQRHDMTGKSVRDLSPPELAEAVIGEYAKMLKRRKPVWFSQDVIVDDERKFTYQYLRLPLSDDGETIDKIVAFSHNRRGFRELESMAEAGLK
ncbi:MAG: PAS domain-containing protein [Rhodospirillaceae bacterium]|nr:PAS domain-containing protein [Rhodospirillaceae bacterium]